MRILHVIPSVAPRDGGPSHAIVPMCAALRSRGEEASIATTDADGRQRLDVPLGATTEWRGIPTIFFHRNASVSFKYSRGLSSWLHRHVPQFQAVHIHGVLSHAPLAAARACRQHGVPYVVRPLGTIASWSLARRAWRKQVLLAVAARHMLSNAAAIHCTSDEECADVHHLGFSRAIVIPLGVEMPAEPPVPLGTTELDAPYVLSLSRLDPKKNLETLIAAFAAAREATGSQWRLVVAGDGPLDYLRALERLAVSCGVGQQVEFTGWVDGARKEVLLRRASLFALASHHENFGIAVLEAAAAGVPSVVSDGVQLAATLRSADAAWVTGADQASVRAGLESAMCDAPLRAQRAAAALAVARRFSWAAVAAQLSALYCRIGSRVESATAAL